MQPVTLTPQRSRALEFGIYRDGDNNLDASQAEVLAQARAVSANDSSIQFTVEDTGSRSFDFARSARYAQDDKVVSEHYTIQDGHAGSVVESKADDMASPDNLAQFVKRTLDNAEASGARQTWIDLVDHGAGDGGGLEADSFKGIMPMPQIAAAIAEGVKLHAQEHPEDSNRNVDGVVANQCLMASMGFADALSRAGVRWLAASPETMLSPGVPSIVAHDIAGHLDDPNAMAKSIVNDVMRTRYDTPIGGIGPAAAFDVLDLDSKKLAAAESAIKAFNDDAASAAHADAGARDALRNDVASVQGMVRFPDATPDMPWHADRPAIATYNAVASDTALDATLRGEARRASDAVAALVLAHKESAHFAPFDGSSYRDAAGPTIHVPVTPKQIDPWAPKVSETNNAFYRDTDAAKITGALA
jgi:hypothetical protein